MSKDATESTKKKVKAEVKVFEGKMQVTKSYYNKEETAEKEIEITPFLSEPAYVSVKAGFTMNLGNYESGRVDIMVSVPCYPEEIEAVYPIVKDMVDTRLAEEYKEMKSSAQVR